MKRFFPEILEEIRGIADSCKLDYDQLTTFILTNGGTENQCSIFAVTDGENVYIGRNYYMYSKFRDHLESCLTMPDDGYWSIGQTDIFVGREHGVNEESLGATMSGITAYFSPGINFWIAIRYILDRLPSSRKASSSPPKYHIIVR